MKTTEIVVAVILAVAAAVLADIVIHPLGANISLQFKYEYNGDSPPSKGTGRETLKGLEKQDNSGLEK